MLRANRLNAAMLLVELVLVCLGVAAAVSPASAAWFDIRRYVFVPAADAPITSGIDTGGWGICH